MTIACSNPPHRQRGYVLLVLLLFVALLSIASLAFVERIEQQVKRDREEELIHRGVQYSRAIRRFIKAFGRYPASIEELESTNNIRFLRKRYKDPITGREFRILHMEDVSYLNTPVPAPTLNVAASQHPQQAVAGTASSASSTNTDPVEKPPQQEENPLMPYTGDPSARDVPSPTQAASPDEVNGDDSPSAVHASPVVGVASTSKARTIREFHNQNRYNQWLFVYNPATDTGLPTKTPDQPLLNKTAHNTLEGAATTQASVNSREPSSE